MSREFHNVGELIKKARFKKVPDFSQHDLSEKLGYKNGQFISNVERGLCNIPFNKIVPLAYILDIPITPIKEAILADYAIIVQNEIDRSILNGNQQ